MSVRTSPFVFLAFACFALQCLKVGVSRVDDAKYHPRKPSLPVVTRSTQSYWSKPEPLEEPGRLA